MSDLVLGYPRDVVESSGQAYFSDDGMYRYALSRVWDVKKPMVQWVGLNPSTADASKLDPTLRRVSRFSIAFGFGGFWMTNLFAYRTPKPAVLREATEAGVDPVGPDNDRWLLDAAHWTKLTIACWGPHGNYRERETEVVRLFDGRVLSCLAITNAGHPRHPLYLKGDLKPKEWVRADRNYRRYK
jgi:hypothetical protein